MESGSKSHENSHEGNDRDTRIQARRLRIEARNASKDDETRKKKQQTDNAKIMSRGQQQIADSLNQLDKRKFASIQHVTSIRVKADDSENARRIQEEEKRHKRAEKLQQEAITSSTQNAAVEMRWSDLFEYSMPQELHRELQLQNQACDEILASKDQLIRDFQTQLKAKDEEYVTALKIQAEDIEQLVERMSTQYRDLQEEYEMELAQMEEAFLKERDELIASNKLEIDSLFEKRREMEMVYMETKQNRDEMYLKEIEELRTKDAEDYNELKIKLETNIQTLEQQLEEMRATYQLNTEKLEYNYRVLTERDMENSATLTQQKRKLARLKDALSTLISKYNQNDSRDKHLNQELTEEYRRLTKQYKELQKKFSHFESSDRLKYEQVWALHEDEAMTKIEKLLLADKVIHEQQLGLGWRQPLTPIRMFSRFGKRDANGVLLPPGSHPNTASSSASAPGSVLGPTSAGSDMDASRNTLSSAGSSDQTGAAAPTTENSDGANDTDSEAGASNSARKISSSKLKHMLRLLCSEAGFLVNASVQEAIENLPDDEAELVKADMILRALGVENEQDMERLMGFFFQDPRQDIAPNEVNSTSSVKWGIKVAPEEVVRTIKCFVEEANEQKKRLAPSLNRILQQKARTTKSKDSDQNNIKNKDRSAKSKHSQHNQEKEFWEALTRVVPARTIRAFHALEGGLQMYHDVLLRRKSLVDEVTELKSQNAELKRLLKQHIGAKINDDLLIPPTKVQTYT